MKTKIKYWILVAFALAALLFLFFTAPSVTVPLIIGIIVAYLINPLVKFLEKHMKRGWALAIILVFLVILLALIVWLVVPAIISEMQEMIERVPEYLDILKNFVARLQEKVDTWDMNINIMQSLEDTLANLQGSLSGMVEHWTDTLLAAMEKVIWIALVPALAFYLLKDQEYFLGLLKKLIPIRYRPSVQRILAGIHKSLMGYLRGQLIVCIIVGVTTSIGLAVFGIKYGLVLGLAMGVFNIIPYFGPFLGGAFITLAAATQGLTKMIIALAVAVGIQQLESTFITPKIVGDTVGIHPLFVILIVLLGGQFMGISGMLLAVPIVLMARETVTTIYKERLIARFDEEKV